MLINGSKNVVKRRFACVLKILDGYVMREFLIPFSVIMIGFIILFFIGDIFDDLKDFLDNHAPVSEMLKYFLLKLPGNIRFILPISVMLACMYEMANFGKNMEIVAMRASGVSIHRACASIYFFALLISLLNFAFNEAIVPFSEKQAYEIIKSRSDKYYVKGQFEMLSYRSPDSLRTWFFREFDSDGVQKTAILKKYNADGVLEWDIEAREAEYINGEGWKFIEGTYTPYSEDGFLPKRSEKFVSRIISTDIAPETPVDMVNSIKPAEELHSMIILDLLSKTQNMAENLKNVYKTTLFSRIAFPFASFIAVFLGIPLAAKNQRGGVFVSIVTAVIIIVAYQLFSHLFLIFGNRGMIPPILAGFAPTVFFVVYGWFNASRNE